MRSGSRGLGGLVLAVLMSVLLVCELVPCQALEQGQDDIYIGADAASQGGSIDDDASDSEGGVVEESESEVDAGSDATVVDDLATDDIEGETIESGEDPLASDEDPIASDDEGEAIVESSDDTAIEQADPSGLSAQEVGVASKESAASASVSYRVHVQTTGDQAWRRDGALAGTAGESRRLEALRVKVAGGASGGVSYRAHVQGVGWQAWRRDGALAGTTGKSRRLEAVQVKLTGALAKKYDVWYRVHVQGGGWMAWAKNGAKAGTEGLSTRMEAIQVRLVTKGGDAPSSADQNVSRAFVKSQTVSYRIRRDGAWQAWRSGGKTAGSANGSKLTGIQASVDGDLGGSISYKVYAQKGGWTTVVTNGAMAASGTRRIEALTVKISGQAARFYNVWYRGYVHGQGWMGWAKNGQKAGSLDQGLALEAIQIRLVSKAQSAPGRTTTPLYDKVEQILSRLSLEQKVAQLFVVTPEALTGGDTVTAGSSTLRSAIASRPVGGIIYFGANLRNPSQTRALLANTKSYAKDACGLVPLQCVDEEGGTVARIAGNSAFGISNVGDMAAIGRSGSTARARSAAKKMGTYLKELGFNVDLAPVADIETLSDGVMARRSFGNNPDLVTSMVRAQVKGFNETGILCTAKHFPGKGGSSGDAHYVRIYTNKTEAQMQSWDLVPFKSAIAEGVPLIMVAHLNCLRFADGDTLPASLNPAIINGLLRTTLGYDGLVITDALGMGAVSDVCSNSRQGVLTIKAGADLILMPQDFSQAYDGLLDAVRSGEISEARINQSVRRIIRAKTSL